MQKEKIEDFLDKNKNTIENLKKIQIEYDNLVFVLSKLDLKENSVLIVQIKDFNENNIKRIQEVFYSVLEKEIPIIILSESDNISEIPIERLNQNDFFHISQLLEILKKVQL